MGNLTVFTLFNTEAYEDYEAHQVTVTQILDFFESHPFLQRIELENPTPDSSDAPPGRIMPLRHLKTLDLNTYSSFPTLVNHLHIPTGASVMLSGSTTSKMFSPLDHLPDKSPNFENLSHITMVNVHFASGVKAVRFGGPSGNLRLECDLEEWRIVSPATVDHQILRPIGPPRLPSIQRLAVSEYFHHPKAGVEECPIFQTLSSLDTLRTLVLSNCNNLTFILALNPDKNKSALVPCSHLEELVLFIPEHSHSKYDGDLVDMTRSRDSRGAKLSSIMIIGPLEPMEEVVSKLEEHVAHVEYKYSRSPPLWDDVPDEHRRVFGES